MIRHAVGGGGKVGNAVAGPYVAGFSTLSINDARYNGSPFNVFCIDWLGIAGDSKVRVLTFNETLTSGDGVATAVRNKFVASGSGTGLDETKLKQVAWLSQQFTDVNQDQWKHIHHAMWGILWDVGATGGAGALPGLTTMANDFVSQSLTAAVTFDASSYRVLAATNGNGVFNSDRQIFIAQVVPEPGTYLLVALGLGGLGIIARRRRVA